MPSRSLSETTVVDGVSNAGSSDDNGDCTIPMLNSSHFIMSLGEATTPPAP